MNILITNFHPKIGGGHLTYVKYLFFELPKLGHNVYVASPMGSKLANDINEFYPDNLYFVDFPGKIKELFLMIKNIFLVSRIIKEKNIEIVHVNGSPDHKIVSLARFFFKLSFKIIRTKHDSHKIKWNFFNKILYKKFTDRMIVVSNYQLKEVVPKTLRNKVKVIENGIDLTRYSPREKSKALLQKYNIGPKDLVFVSIAGSGIHKGWSLMLKALANNPMLSCKIVIAGGTPTKSILESEVPKQIRNKVFFTSFLDDVRDVVGIADVGFVLSQSVETISYACREMMAMAKPVIVSDYGGLPENITPNYDGWVVDPNNTAILSELISSLTKELIKVFSENALRKATKNFALKDSIIKTNNIYIGLE